LIILIFLQAKVSHTYCSYYSYPS